MLKSVEAKCNEYENGLKIKIRIRNGLGLSLLVLLLGAGDPPIQVELESSSLRQAANKILDENNACVAIDNGCVSCALNGSELVCSTPRITCIAHDYRCSMTSRGHIDVKVNKWELP